MCYIKNLFIVILISFFSGCSGDINKLTSGLSNKLLGESKEVSIQEIDITKEVNIFQNEINKIIKNETFESLDIDFDELKKNSKLSDLYIYKKILEEINTLSTSKKNYINKELNNVYKKYSRDYKESKIFFEKELMKEKINILNMDKELQEAFNKHKRIETNDSLKPEYIIKLLYTYLKDASQYYNTNGIKNRLLQELNNKITDINELNEHTWTIDSGFNNTAHALLYQVNEVKYSSSFLSPSYNKKVYDALYKFKIKYKNNRYILNFEESLIEDKSLMNRFKSSISNKLILNTLISFISDIEIINKYGTEVISDMVDIKYSQKNNKNEFDKKVQSIKREYIDNLIDKFVKEIEKRVKIIKNIKENIIVKDELVFYEVYMNLLKNDTNTLRYIISNELYKNKNYLTFTKINESVFNKVNIKLNNRYKVARFIFNNDIRKDVKYNIMFLKKFKNYDGLHFSIIASDKNFVTDEDLESYFIDFYLPKKYVIEYFFNNITGQKLIDESIVLIDKERVKLDLDK